MAKIPGKCPVCGEKMHISTVKCDCCGTTVNNDFELSPFDRLDEKQTEFAVAFIECEGSIKDMEKRFGISYPTVKSRLAELRKALSGAEKSYNQTVLDGLRDGELDFESALKMILDNKR